MAHFSWKEALCHSHQCLCTNPGCRAQHQRRLLEKSCCRHPKNSSWGTSMPEWVLNITSVHQSNFTKVRAKTQLALRAIRAMEDDWWMQKQARHHLQPSQTPVTTCNLAHVHEDADASHRPTLSAAILSVASEALGTTTLLTTTLPISTQFYRSPKLSFPAQDPPV